MDRDGANTILSSHPCCLGSSGTRMRERLAEISRLIGQVGGTVLCRAGTVDRSNAAKYRADRADAGSVCVGTCRWSDARRALIRAELDARIARLYGLTRAELRYILDPADV